RRTSARATTGGPIEMPSNRPPPSYITRGTLLPREKNDATSTRRKKLHAMPRRHSPADPAGGCRLARSSAALGAARRRQADRADLPLQKFPGGVCRRGARGGTRRNRSAPSRDQLWLGLRNDLAPDKKDQRAARKRLHHGGQARPACRRDGFLGSGRLAQHGGRSIGEQGRRKCRH